MESAEVFRGGTRGRADVIMHKRLSVSHEIHWQVDVDMLVFSVLKKTSTDLEHNRPRFYNEISLSLCLYGVSYLEEVKMTRFWLLLANSPHTAQSCIALR